MAQAIRKIENGRQETTADDVPPPLSAVARPHGSKGWALDAMGLAAILGICYFAEQTLVIILVSALIAFILAPVADLFTWLRAPRPIAAALAVLLLIGLLIGITYLGINQASNLIEELPRHSSEIRQDLAKITQIVKKLEVLAPAQEKGTVTVRETTTWADLLTRGFGSASQVILGGSFIPFLVFFMLTWQEHARNATLGLVAPENRRAAYVTMGLISAMIRNFMIGNLVIGLVMGGVSTIVFGLLHIPFFLFAGFFSGFLSLVPYLGVAIALLPPIFLGIGHLSLSTVIWIVLTVFTLHVVSINVLYPKFLGGQLRLNPLTVTIALLVWGWLWGATGLVLAVPITAAMKIVFDHVEPLKPFGVWLGGEQPPTGAEEPAR
jgi:predicted PurR-regulated permease PerM